MSESPVKDKPPPRHYPELWDCPNHHVLGYVEHHGRRRSLIIFRQALPAKPTESDFEITGEAIGDLIVYCSICGARRRWYYEKIAPVKVGAIAAVAVA